MTLDPITTKASVDAETTCFDNMNIALISYQTPVTAWGAAVTFVKRARTS
jgi:hypothetical protein